jgi:lipopolysaccharide transport system ATP-binding protein
VSDVAIAMHGLSKRYKMRAADERYRTLRDLIADAVVDPIKMRRTKVETQRRPRASRDFWALKNVSLDVKTGEAVGIIGRNGAGKSTLLKILARITEPTEGYADVRGRVGSLLEVGTGFHPELTGRENIYLSGAILGMTRSEITRKLEAIVSFAEVTAFIDTPVKHYSSGMYLRLAFAVAAHLEPEILIVDEVLAVGDIAFQRKCLGKMEYVAAEGRTVLFVSHNLAAVKELCRLGVVLRSGVVDFCGSVAEALAHYHRTLTEQLEGQSLSGDRWQHLTVNAKQAAMPVPLRCDEPIVAEAVVTTHHCLASARLYCLIKNAGGDLLVCSEQHVGCVPADTVLRAHVSLPALWLAPGVYGLYLKLTGRTANGLNFAVLSQSAMLDIDGPTGGRYRATLTPRASWHFEPQPRLLNRHLAQP